MIRAAANPHAQLSAALAKKKRGAGRAKWTRDLRGRNHPSGEEADWFNAQYAREDRGEIVIEAIEPAWEIFIHSNDAAKLARLCSVKADMRVREGGRVRFIDFKGRLGDTAVSRLKRKMVLIQHGIEIELVGKYVEREAKRKAQAKAERDLLKRARK